MTKRHLSVSHRLPLSLVVVCCLCGCVTKLHLPASYERPQSLPEEYLAQFCYQAHPVAESVALIKEKRRYRVFDVLLDAAPGDEDPLIELEFYAPRQDEPAPAPLVLMLPVLNGTKHLMRPFATHFVKGGYAVAIVDTVQRRTLLQDMAHPEQAIRQSVQRHRRVIDWAASRPDLDISRLGVFGASLGGFNALFLAAIDNRVRVVSPALIGGGLPSVLTTSNERRIKAAVDGAKLEMSMDDDQLMQHLTDNIQTDTLALAPHIDASRVLMVMAKRDEAVAYESLVRLREAMGGPDAYVFPTGHSSTAAYIFYLRSRIRDFFDRKLAEPGTTGTATGSDELCSSAT